MVQGGKKNSRGAAAPPAPILPAPMGGGASNFAAILQLFFSKIRILGIFWSKFLLKNRVFKWLNFKFLNDLNVLMRSQQLRPEARVPTSLAPSPATPLSL